MKITHLAVAFILGGWLMHGGEVAAQRSVATYTKEATDSLIPLLERAANGGFRQEPSTSTIFGGWLPKGSATGNERWIPMLVLKNLDPNLEYRIIAAGDNDIKDLDLRVVDPTGKVVAEDVKVARTAEVTFRPARQQDYTIELRVYDSSDNGIGIGAVLRRQP